MKRIINMITSLLILFSIQISAKLNPQTPSETSNNILDLIVKNIDGKEVKLSQYKGKVLLIVNVASKCGYTPQYEGLEKLYEKYKDNGFEILAFPCNDFGGQEPGTTEEIKEFCSTKYNVTFPLFDKIKVIGKEKSPLYERLINSKNVEQGDIKWNFEKFLIDKNGEIVARFRSKVKPESEELVSAIEKELNKK
ncbi:glutathione peroxidase [Stygiobacter electus]|uniref:Glutathione peroxidase n=1 Tax=Stygiobacter electus TaxID=3032292 RepID=A0AAE3NXD5_9BACT|nr:glutathione peroxidase [Stygiobacter electus]MDF1611811.1 glutathione peroxidase [Stygiobacter electus]